MRSMHRTLKTLAVSLVSLVALMPIPAMAGATETPETYCSAELAPGATEVPASTTPVADDEAKQPSAPSLREMLASSPKEDWSRGPSSASAKGDEEQPVAPAPAPKKSHRKAWTIAAVVLGAAAVVAVAGGGSGSGGGGLGY